MREIKFRAWEHNQNSMHYGVESGIYEDPDEIISFDRVLELTRYEVMQYTGIKDKDGKEIYEGDIVHLENMLISDKESIDGVVVFNEGAWWVENKEELRAERLWGECNYLRVKGNIYENPELASA